MVFIGERGLMARSCMVHILLRVNKEPVMSQIMGEVNAMSSKMKTKSTQEVNFSLPENSNVTIVNENKMTMM
jgi:hypothetical protein